MPTNHLRRKHPLLLYILAFAEFWDRFSYYGVQALFVLYLTHVFKYSDKAAYSFYGIFTSLTFAATILGGVCADKFIGLKNGIIAGTLLIILGNIFLTFPGQYFLYLGFATLICGIGFFKPNSATLAGKIYENETETARAGGFSIFYMGMNAGALAGPIIYGCVEKIAGWHAAFWISAIGSLLSLLLFLLRRALSIEHCDSVHLSFFKKIFFALMIAALIGFLVLLMQYSQLFASLLEAIALMTVCGLIYIAFKSQIIERKHIAGLSLLSFFCIFYFACSLQTATTLTLFIERNLNKNFFGFQLSTMMFLSLQPFFIILMAPFMERVWSCLHKRNLCYSAASKLALGMLCTSISFYIFSSSAITLMGNNLKLLGIVLGNFMLGLGELCTLPILLAAISNYSPPKWRSTMMGVFFLSLAFSGYFAGIIAKITSTPSVNLSNINFAHGFAEISVVAFLISVLMFVLTPIFTNLLK